ncbi:ribonuclease D [Arcanobacterium phocae]|uniref:Ribonuclease D n=1 Tax=Arcanobacterium phocae TaxID=131112 RepID=A0A1H2LJZ9_9ACTO|nr:HRDC domain-containing protein [Arcanobacterium phocae]SDU81249.1 ribonuclease D [Arcanobacterium phocae]
MILDDNPDLRLLAEPRAGLPDITHDTIAHAVTALRNGHGPFAVDTERAMGLRYSNRAYLIQIKRAGAGIFLIDPIGIEDQLGDLATIMDDEWILHAADQDLPCLRELGLEPARVFDTEVAGLVLGYDHVSLQSMVAEEFGIALAKEYSNADWSQRPLGPELRAYAALDVELLIELKESLTIRLRDAGRYDWFVQECEEVRCRPLPAPHPQPWRKAVKYAKFPDQRSLAMLKELWQVRDIVARERDLAPGKVLPNKILATLAARKPRSRADVQNSSLFRSRGRKRDATVWWDAIHAAWNLPQNELPARKFSYSKDPFPPIQRWEKLRPEAAERWTTIRTAVLEHADRLGIRQEVLLKPRIQKQLAWDGWTATQEIPDLLESYGARPWQIEQVCQALG